MKNPGDYYSFLVFGRILRKLTKVAVTAKEDIAYS